MRRKATRSQTLDAAIQAYEQGNPPLAMEYLNFIPGFRHGNQVPIDPIVNKLVKEIAESMGIGDPQVGGGPKIRLGYLTEGFDITQAPVKNLLQLVQGHDKDQFDITVYSRFGPDTTSYILKGQEYYAGTIEKLEAAGATVVFLSAPTWENLIKLRDRIVRDRIDILSTYALYTVPAIHLLCASQPAPIIVKDCWQQPEFSNIPDLTIHCCEATFRADTGNKILIPWRWSNPFTTKEYGTNGYTREKLGLPKDRVCIAIVGRNEKFSPEFWDLLEKAVFSCGPPFPFVGVIGETGPENNWIKYLGRFTDVPALLKVFDFYVDTFPLGGGMALAEATFAGLPVVTLEAPLTEGFRVDDWSMPEIPANPALTIPRGDPYPWLARVQRLATDSDFRRDMAEFAHQRAKELGDTATFMAKREAELIKLYNTKKGNRGCNSLG